MGGDVDGDVTADTNNDAQDVSNDNANLVTGTTSEAADAVTDDYDEAENNVSYEEAVDTDQPASSDPSQETEGDFVTAMAPIYSGDVEQLARDEQASVDGTASAQATQSDDDAQATAILDQNDTQLAMSTLSGVVTAASGTDENDMGAENTASDTAV